MISRKNTTRPFYRIGFTGWFRGLLPFVSPSPGKVKGSWVSGSVKGSRVSANVEGAFSVGSVRGSVIFLSEV